MLEKECIQSRGFRNTMIAKKVVGFQFDIRLMYYRGVWLSQLRPISVIVDGQKVSSEAIRWEFDGMIFTEAEMENIGNIQWNVFSPATIYISNERGLTSGYHTIEVSY